MAYFSRYSSGVTFSITASQGLTNLGPDDQSLETLYGRADAAMYQAKRQGKNQIVLV